MCGGELYKGKRRGGMGDLFSCSNGQHGKGVGGKLGRGVKGYRIGFREGVWVIGCASPVMLMMGMLDYKDKPFDK